MTGVLLFFLLSFLSTDDTLSRDECHVARDDYRVIDVSSWIGQDRPWNVRKSFDENRGGLFSPPVSTPVSRQPTIRNRDTMFTGFLLHRRNANRAPSTRGQVHLVIESISCE